MEDDAILAKVQEEFQPKTTKQGLVYLAAKIQAVREDCTEMKELQRRQNGRVNKNAEDIARLQGQISCPWKPQSKKGWIGASAVVFALITFAATLAARLIELEWWP